MLSLLLLPACLVLAKEPVGNAAARALCEEGAPIVRVDIISSPIFDPEDPETNRWLHRSMNWLHKPMQSRLSSVASLLMIREGDRCSTDLLEEAERRLRSLGFLQDAWVEAVDSQEGGVVVGVRTQDSWSTRLGITYSNEGGESRSRIRLLEENLFGYAKRLELSIRKDQDRDERLLAFVDPAILGSRWQANLATSDNSDGELQLARIQRPFWSLDTRWMLLMEARREIREEKVYEAGEEVDRWQSDIERARFHVGFSRLGLRDDRLTRWIFELERAREQWRPAAPGEPISRPGLRPYDRDTITAGVRLSTLRIDIRRSSRVFGDRRVEDLDLSRELTAGFAASIPGVSQDDAGTAFISFRRGYALGNEGYLFTGASQTLHWLRGGFYDTLSRISLSYHTRLAPRRTLVIHASGDRGENLSGPSRFLLGGDTGLRAYPSRAFSGTRSILLVCEMHFFTDWTLGRVLGVGLTAFAELGGAWDEGHTLGKQDLHPGIGIGLRLPIIPSARGTTVHLNAAIPLDPNGVTEGRKLRFSATTAFGF